MELDKQDVDVLIWCIVFHIELESKFANSLLNITTVRELSGEKKIYICSVFLPASFYQRQQIVFFKCESCKKYVRVAVSSLFILSFTCDFCSSHEDQIVYKS